MLPEDRREAVAPDGVAASLVAEKVSPAAGAEHLPVLGAVQGDRTGAGDDDNPGPPGEGCFQGDPGVRLDDDVLEGKFPLPARRSDRLQKFPPVAVTPRPRDSDDDALERLGGAFGLLARFDDQLHQRGGRFRNPLTLQVARPAVAFGYDRTVEGDEERMGLRAPSVDA